MISWTDNDVMEPSMVKHVTDESLNELINETSQAQPNSEEYRFNRFPSNSMPHSSS